MGTRQIELRVGAAVIMSIIVLVGGILWGKGCKAGLSRYKIQITFNNIGGMEEGSNVLANGVVKGRVTEIRLGDGRVIVDAMVDKDVRIYSDYIIAIESPTLMAGKALAIYPGSELPAANVNEILRGTDPVGVAEAMSIFQSISGELRTTLSHVNDLLVNLNEVAGDSSNKRNLGNLITNANSTAEQTSEFLRTHRTQIGAMLQKLDSTVASFQRIAGTAESKIGPTLVGLDSAATMTTDLATSLRDIVQKFEQRDNTVGRLLSDDSLYVQLNKTLAQVDSLAESLRTKGLRHKIVLF